MVTFKLYLGALGVCSGVSSLFMLGACSSDDGAADESGTGGSRGSIINIGTGGSGGGGGGAASNPAANDADGLKAIAADVAAGMVGNACQGWASEPEGGGPAILEFMVDTTGSMDETTPSTGGQSKWEAMQAALPQALASLPSTWAVGLSFFSRPQSCYRGAQAVPIAPLDAPQQTRLDNAIQSRTTGGYTPTEAAYVFALEQVQTYVAPPAFAGARRYVVLVTDGIPTVNSDGCTLGGVGRSAITLDEYGHLIGTVNRDTIGTGIKTFVVGVPGSEDPQGANYDPMYQLSLVAVAGQTALQGCTPRQGTPQDTTVNPRGTYCHYDMTQAPDFAAGLLDAIGTIATNVVSCNYKVPPAPAGEVIDAARTNLIYNDGQGNNYLLLQNTGANCTVGWHFTDATNQSIEVCSTTCDLLQSNPLASMSLVFGCVAGGTTVM
jgi:hypothetical protein